MNLSVTKKADRKLNKTVYLQYFDPENISSKEIASLNPSFTVGLSTETGSGMPRRGKVMARNESSVNKNIEVTTILANFASLGYRYAFVIPLFSLFYLSSLFKIKLAGSRKYFTRKKFPKDIISDDLVIPMIAIFVW